MRYLIAICTVLTVSGLITGMAPGETKSVASARPSVVKTIPRCGATSVNPALTEIMVTFSKKMKDGNWSWCLAQEGEFPEMAGTPLYLPDGRTCVLTVKLKPKTTYAIWLNTNSNTNFKDTEGRAAVPYLLVFETE